MRARVWMCAAVLIALPAVASARQADADMQKVADQYQAAYNKADAKTLAAMYAADAHRLGPDGQLLKGRAAIEKSYVDGFAGPFKGSKLTLTQGATQTLTPDVKVIEGRYTVAGAVTITGRYVNTVIRKGGQWLLATVVTRPDTPAPAAPAKE
jgi:uncharacterized protein (TIGR02246 family)